MTEPNFFFKIAGTLFLVLSIAYNFSLIPKQHIEFAVYAVPIKDFIDISFFCTSRITEWGPTNFKVHEFLRQRISGKKIVLPIHNFLNYLEHPLIERYSRVTPIFDESYEYKVSPEKEKGLILGRAAETFKLYADSKPLYIVIDEQVSLYIGYEGSDGYYIVPSK